MIISTDCQSGVPTPAVTVCPQNPNTANGFPVNEGNFSLDKSKSMIGEVCKVKKEYYAACWYRSFVCGREPQASRDGFSYCWWPAHFIGQFPLYGHQTLLTPKVANASPLKASTTLLTSLVQKIFLWLGVPQCPNYLLI